jgi:hypothetical protein
VDKDFTVEISVLDITSGKSIEELASKIVSLLRKSAATAGAELAAPIILKVGDFTCILPVSKPNVRLLCFPYYGSKASVYHPWVKLLDARVEVWIAEPYDTSDWHELLGRLEKSVDSIIQNDTITPLAIYGHSLGASVAYEFAMHLQSSPGT